MSSLVQIKLHQAIKRSKAVQDAHKKHGKRYVATTPAPQETQKAAPLPSK